MKHCYQTGFTLILLQFLYINNCISCGYDFIGGCSTGVSFSINGSIDSFNVADCSFGNRYQNTDFGTVRTLFLKNSRSITWESCENNVTAVALHYRIFKVGQSGAGWTILDLPEAYNTAVGPYTTRYRRANVDTDLTAGLVISQTYVIELFFRAEVDTLGNDFVPETEMIQNNQGQNYQLRFTYGGPSAAPFTVVKNMQVNPKCHGDSTGIAGVSVYGDQSGLFYAWSYVQNNFNMEFNLPAGQHYVTVTGSSGYVEIDTFTITEPDALEGDFIGVQNIGCDLSLGKATLSMSNGLAPFTYVWQDGVTTAMHNFSDSGTWSVTATDARGCKEDFSILILGGGDLQVNVTGTGKNVSPCGLGLSIALTFVAHTNATEPIFSWVLNGQIISTNDTCILVTSAFPLPIPLLSVTDDATNCSDTYYNSQLPITITEPLPPLITTTIVTNSTGTNIPDGDIYLSVIGGNGALSFLWNTGATTQNIFNLLAGEYCCTVTDGLGCTTTRCATVSAPSATLDLGSTTFKVYPTLVSAGDQIYIESLESKSPLLNTEIMDMLGIVIATSPPTMIDYKATLALPQGMASGNYILRCFNGVKWGLVRVVVY